MERVIQTVVLSILTVLAVHQSAAAQTPPIPNSRRGVDSVTVNGSTYYGFVLERTKQRVTIAVERSWLVTTYPDQADTFREQEISHLKPIVAQYTERIDKWIAERQDEVELIRFLEMEKERIVAENSDPGIDDKRFIQLRFKKKEAKKVSVQPDKRRKIAAVAMKYQLKNIAGRATRDLKDELESIDVELDLEVVNFTTDLAAAVLTDREWNIRKSMVELTVLGELEYQGQGDLLIKKSEKPDVSALLANMMSSARNDSISRIGRELGIPEFSNGAAATPKDWRRTVTEAADNEGYRSILVKRILSNANPNQVDVESVFFAKTDKSKWEIIKRVAKSAKLSDQADDDLVKIRDDPQIQSLLKTLGGLGLGNDASLLDTAVRKGAATQAALMAADQEMDDFLGANTQYLDSRFQKN